MTEDAQRRGPAALPGISVVMSAHNEASMLPDCVASVRDIAAEVVVVDSHSTDDTVEVAKRLADVVIERPNLLMLGINKNVAIDAAHHEWVLVLDPDERVSPALAVELQAIAGRPGGPNGYGMPRRNYELGRWIRTMGKYPGTQVRFFRRGRGRFRCEHIHELLEVDGAVGQLQGHLDHHPPQDLATYIHKRNLYSEHRAEQLRDSGTPFRLWRMLARPPAGFLKEYVLRGGWREGITGLVMCVTHAYALFLQDAKLWERWREPASADSRTEIFGPLGERSGDPAAPDRSS